MKADYIVKKGETLHIQLEVVDGDIDLVSVISAKMKKAGPNGSVPASTEPVAATFTIVKQATYWDFYLSDTETDALEVGFYVVDAKLELIDGSVDKTNSIIVQVKPSVS